MKDSRSVLLGFILGLGRDWVGRLSRIEIIKRVIKRVIKRE